MRLYAVLTTLVLVGLLLPLASASVVRAPSDGCLFFAYVDDGATHYSMLADNATLVGTTLTVLTTCEDEFVVSIDGAAKFGGTSAVTFDMGQDVREVGVTMGNWSTTYRNLTVFPGADFGELVTAGDPPLIDPITLSAQDLASHEALTVFAGSVILWALTTMVAWRAVNWWVDRYHLEEVV